MDTVTSEQFQFNPKPPSLMHVDLNSCFASIEQQANPRLRGKPVAVAAYTSPGGCILAASREAKALGVTTGMRVRDGVRLCRGLIVMPSDPNKYRYVNRKLVSLLEQYSDQVEVKSIDEMVIEFSHSPFLKRVLGCLPPTPLNVEAGMRALGREIKDRIKAEIGDWLTVSVGIAPNRYLAKVAAGLHKPDGLDVITAGNIEEVLGQMRLEDLTGIKEGYGTRLRNRGIASALAFYRAPIRQIRNAFHSVIGHHWWMRLHGWEVDDRAFAKRSVGHSYALYEPYRRSDPRLAQILRQLTEKMGSRLRSYGMRAGGIHLSCLLGEGGSWHRGESLALPIYADSDLYAQAVRILSGCPDELVRNLSASCFRLSKDLYLQLALDRGEVRKQLLTQAVDKIHERWGRGIVTSGRAFFASQKIKDRIAFGGVKDLEAFIYRDPVVGERVVAE